MAKRAAEYSSSPSGDNVPLLTTCARVPGARSILCMCGHGAGSRSMLYENRCGAAPCAGHEPPCVPCWSELVPARSSLHAWTHFDTTCGSVLLSIENVIPPCCVLCDVCIHSVTVVLRAVAWLARDTVHRPQWQAGNAAFGDCLLGIPTSMLRSLRA